MRRTRAAPNRAGGRGTQPLEPTRNLYFVLTRRTGHNYLVQNPRRKGKVCWYTLHHVSTCAPRARATRHSRTPEEFKFANTVCVRTHEPRGEARLQAFRNSEYASLASSRAGTRKGGGSESHGDCRGTPPTPHPRREGGGQIDSVVLKRTTRRPAVRSVG